MYFKINGIDILPYIAEDGLKWTRNDVDASDAGRTMDATMHRGRVAVKERIDLTMRPMKTEHVNMILNLILPEYVTLEWDFDPLYGYVNKQMYSNNVPATCATIYPDGMAVWDDITFPLVER